MKLNQTGGWGVRNGHIHDWKRAFDLDRASICRFRCSCGAIGYLERHLYKGGPNPEVKPYKHPIRLPALPSTVQSKTEGNGGRVETHIEDPNDYKDYQR
jgi:hypothetical protein